MESISPKVRNKTRVPTLTTTIQHSFGSFGHSSQSRKRNKRNPDWNSREGNGTPLQYSCLANPMAGGAWKAAVHGVAKSRTRLSDFPFTFLFQIGRASCR